MKLKELCEVMDWSVYLDIRYDRDTYYEGNNEDIPEEYKQSEVKECYPLENYKGELSIVVCLREKPTPTFKDIISRLSKEQEKQAKTMLMQKFNIEW